jgi:Ca2+:H+ antiporter
MARVPKPSASWLFAFVPATLLLEHAEGAGEPLVFFSAALAIVPIARLIGRSTESLAHYTGDAVGGLLNATFGNLPEMIIAIVALRAGLYEMVAASIVGVILANLLLATGLAFLLGGLRWHTQEFNPGALSVYGSMMFIAVISLTLPSMYERAFVRAGPIPQQEATNFGLAVLLLVLYALYLVFMLRTGLLRLAPLPACARERVGVVAMALRNRLDLTLGIVFGSCIQIALFVAPMLVFASYAVGPSPFQLSFSTGGVGLVFLAVLIATLVSSRGTENWYKGVQLLAVYGMIALMLYFAPI